MIIAGSTRVGKFPMISGALDWTPVDVVGNSTIELALQQRRSGEVAVHHLVNPHPSTYSELAASLKSLGVRIDPVSAQEWWTAIQAVLVLLPC